MSISSVYRSNHAATCCKATVLVVGLIGIVAGAAILGLAANQNLGQIGSNGFIWGVTGGGCLVYASLSIEIIFARVFCKKKSQGTIETQRGRQNPADDFIRRNPDHSDSDVSSVEPAFSDGTHLSNHDVTIPRPKAFLPVSNPSTWPKLTQFDQFLDLPAEVQLQILSAAPFGDLTRSLGVSTHYYDLGQITVIQKASSFGYEGQNFAEAREYLKTFLQCVRSLSQFIDNPEFKTPCASIEEIEYRAVCLQKLTVEEIYSLYANITISEIGKYKTLTAYLLKLVEKQVITGKVGAKPQQHHLMGYACIEEINLLKLFLKIGVDPNLAFASGNTPLQFAAQERHLQAIKLLLEHNAEINAMGGVSVSPLCFTLASSKIGDKAQVAEIVRLLLEKGADPNLASVTTTGKYYSPLYFAFARGYDEALDLLLAHEKTEINSKNCGGNTLLWELVQLAKTENQILIMLTLLLERKADPTIKSVTGKTVLELAIEKKFYLIIALFLNELGSAGYLPLYKLLESAADAAEIDGTVSDFLSRGADPSVKTQSGDTPLHLAVTRGFIQTLSIMLEKASDVDVQNGNGETPFYLALTRETDEEQKELVAGKLIAKGANPNIPTHNGRLALHHALLNNHWNVFRFLLDHGADVNAIGDEGHTPLIYAIRNPQKVASDEEKLLIWLNELFDKANADANQKNGKGKPPLYYALKMNNLKIIELLLSKGADVNAAMQGESLLMKVIVDEKLEESAKEALVDLLIAKGADLRFQSDRGSTIFHYAAFAGSLPLLEKFYNQVPDLLDKPDNKGLTPLCRAAKQGHQEAAFLLRDKGADPDNLLKIIK